ncbi:Ppx/GppA phosphatase family protein [Chitiniphilus eburneus]|uniref:Ppx/GppA family phosphatase n=1 Tax=Chitiniphilus eburneus TaxID=2571148 RepID=A0A4U0PXR3_9NEIS|nr:Ppx/GppA phosphatase family protein [Chitiniphilus eburneus]TJZ73040.1 Ppx/GppA family phosphatase [Chitiniphilus eburneus]
MPDRPLIAAVDLGSNSFRLQVIRVVSGSPRPVTTLKETVRLGAGLDGEGTLTAAAQDEAVAALARFAPVLAELGPDQVRAVATNTFRVANNATVFLPRAEAALGFPIEIIGGREEARLIYLGAAHSLPSSKERRLVVDIGGGSTELIVGRQFTPLCTESVPLGSVSWSARFFPDGGLSEARLREAELAARSALQPFEADFGKAHWQSSIGTSGTARALADVLEANGLSSRGISRSGLGQLRQALLRAGHIDHVKLAGIREDRRPVMGGGFAIMAAVFDAFGIEQMDITFGALRDGVMYDLMARRRAVDVRDRTVAAFARHCRVDGAQAERVALLAGSLFDQVTSDEPALRRSLADAALLHEVGVSIAQADFHKHSAYLLRHADLAGFSLPEQERMAVLVSAQRGVLRVPVSPSMWHAVLALRLATLLYRARAASPHLPSLALATTGDGYCLTLPSRWLDQQPVIRFALNEEADVWQKAGKPLRIQAV